MTARRFVHRITGIYARLDARTLANGRRVLHTEGGTVWLDAAELASEWKELPALSLVVAPAGEERVA